MKKEKLFIITCDPYEQFDCNGKSLGMSEKSAIFYSPSIGRTRYYRQSISEHDKKLKLLTFKTEQRAQQVCDITNNICVTSAYKVEMLNPKQNER